MSSQGLSCGGQARATRIRWLQRKVVPQSVRGVTDLDAREARASTMSGGGAIVPMRHTMHPGSWLREARRIARTPAAYTTQACANHVA